MPRILLVGTGVTGSLTASILRQELPKAELILWDKARHPGGRMTTHWNDRKDSSVDLGVQYITATPDYAKLHHSYYKELSDAGILSPLTTKVAGMKTVPEGTHHYVIPQGSSSIIHHFLKKTNSEPKYHYHVESIDPLGKKWEVRTKAGEKEAFDVVVLTMPAPQLLELSGHVKDIIHNNKSLHQQIKSVEYSSRFALGLFYKRGDNVSMGDHCAQYIAHDNTIRFVAIDNMKRGRTDVAPSVVVHTSVPYGKAHIEKTKEEMAQPLLAKVKELFPDWPEPESVRCHKWKFSQVSSAFPGLPGAVTLGEGLVAGGDSFTHSNLDGCIESAKVVTTSVLEYLSSL